MDLGTALLIVDVQSDFCPGGALSVPAGDRVVEPLNRIARRCAEAGVPVLATRDWHPLGTRHFRERGGPWPPHCVQGSPGAEFDPALRLPEGTLVISKGTDPDTDGYSAFEAADADGQDLREILASLGVRRLLIGGLATDYCVRASVLEARRMGLDVVVLADAVAGVDMAPGDSARALDEMERAGATFAGTDEFLQRQ